MLWILATLSLSAVAFLIGALFGAGLQSSIRNVESERCADRVETLAAAVEALMHSIDARRECESDEHERAEHERAERDIPIHQPATDVSITSPKAIVRSGFTWAVDRDVSAES